MLLFRRPVLLAAGLAAAVASPYVALDDGISSRARSVWGSLTTPSESDPLAAAVASSTAPLPATAIAPAPASLEEVFRFDVTPAWVTARWKRISTVLGEREQLGLRVALVTGTQSDDIAGSLTYYFDKHHQLARITFVGLTGDSRRVLTAVVAPYGLKSQPTTDAAHYVAGDPQKPTSQVTVRHLAVVSDQMHARQEVAIDLRRGNIASAAIRGAPAAGVPSPGLEASEPKLLPTSYRRW